MRHRFDDPELNRTLERFLHELVDLFGDRLISVMLHGSVVFDDLAPGYGDLDFLAVVEGDLAEETRGRLVSMRKPLRADGSRVYARMLEGAFLPRHMLDPARPGKAFWWGTSGERPWERNRLGPLVHLVIREHGIVIRGEDVRSEIPRPTRAELLEDVARFCESAETHGCPGRLHSIEWLLTTARLLLWLREGRLSSKSEAADWGATHAHGPWRTHLGRAREMRLSPSDADSMEGRLWLNGLGPAILMACEELRQELSTRRNR
jgi:predicted nucleotidyltransferase